MIIIAHISYLICELIIVRFDSSILDFLPNFRLTSAVV